MTGFLCGNFSKDFTPMNSPCEITKFEIVPLNKEGGYAINDRGRTVALITQGDYVDWLLISPLQDGPLVDTIHKDTHLSYVLGYKFVLHCPYIRCAGVESRDGTHLTRFDYRIEDEGQRVILIGEAAKPDGPFVSRTEAVLYVTPDGVRYEWELRTVVTSTSDLTQKIELLEYNNVYPALAYRGILHGSKKEFDCTLMQDGEGTVWEFPHQHSLHYGKKIDTLKFGTQSWAGFFGSPNSCPVVIAESSGAPLFWGICDMYYDLHCNVAAPYTFEPRGELSLHYFVKYISPAEAREWSRNTRKIPISEEDKIVCDYPRFDFGFNPFNRGVHIDLPDEACCFRPNPPEKVWDRETGNRTKGSLRLASEGETIVWSSEPPIHTINGTKLQIRGLARVQDVSGKGFFLRLQYYDFRWKPTPGFYPIKTLDSEALTGTSDGWVTITIPELEIPHGPVEDGMLRLEVVLEGSGTGWVTEIQVELEALDISQAAPMEHELVRQG